MDALSLSATILACLLENGVSLRHDLGAVDIFRWTYVVFVSRSVHIFGPWLDLQLAEAVALFGDLA